MNHMPLCLPVLADDFMRRMKDVTETLNRFLRDEQAQDLIEYTLLLAFVCLASAALFISAGGSVAGIWTSTNTDLATANTAAS
jgi:Flp pilus assembly pilin Flp